MTSNDSPTPSFIGTTAMSISKPYNATNPHEISLQAYCKSMLKSRIFRGFYRERHYVEAIGEYRDLVLLQRGEKELERLLTDIMCKLHMCYQNKPKMWIGITHDQSSKPGVVETFIWSQFDGLAFGDYWFTIKAVRFRENEILLKLKMLRPFEAEVMRTPRRQRSSSSTSINATQATADEAAKEHGMLATNTVAVAGRSVIEEENSIQLQDFQDIVHEWGITIKETLYNFMANDISKENIKSTLRFFGLLIVALIGSFVAGLRFLAIFTLHFMVEMRRFTYVLTPVLLKMIDVFGKIIGGIFILITMVWREFMSGKSSRPSNNYKSVEYNRPLYKAIEYDVRKNSAQQQQQQQSQYQE